jgi:SAM-dependent methyltransferase
MWLINKYNIYKKYTFLELLRKLMIKLASRKPRESLYVPILKEEFSNISFGAHGIQKMIDNYDFSTVLDIGCGDGKHADIFLKNNKKVVAIDYGDSIYFEQNKGKLSTVIADFNNWQTEERFDAVWCSHVLEHQLNVNLFLGKIFTLLKSNGILAITVPPGDDLIVGGHLTNWNAGLLLYNLVLAGFDCSNARVLQYGYNITVIVQKHKNNTVDLSKISYDCGDLKKLQSYFPKIERRSTELDEPFDGDIYSLNWND